jgi:hypothetical protein
MAGGSIILEPKDMFNTLSEMEKATQDILKLIQTVQQILEAASALTFAVGFGELIKAAEAAINQVGSAVVAANNAFNSACKDVVNQLVEKFSPEGAKSDYGSPPFVEITIKINTPDRAQIYPPQIQANMDQNKQTNTQLANKSNDMREIYRQTQNFWVGESADKTRNSFETKMVPQFEDLKSALDQIVQKGIEWVEDAVKFEASLGV